MNKAVGISPSSSATAGFASERNGLKNGTRLIKRLVGVPGDVVELRDDRLYVNGVAAQYQNLKAYREPRDYAGSTMAVKSAEIIAGSRREIQFLPEVLARRNFGPVVVPAVFSAETVNTSSVRVPGEAVAFTPLPEITPQLPATNCTLIAPATNMSFGSTPVREASR